MDVKKALIGSVVLYALVFLAASGLMFAFPVESMGFKIVMPILAATLTFVIANYYYFQNFTIKDPVSDGLAVGVTFAVVGFLIEIPVMVYGFAAEQGWNYFTQWNLMLGYLLTIVVPILVAYMKK